MKILRIAVALIGSLLITGLLGSPASAQAGDVVLYHDGQTLTELRTNDCTSSRAQTLSYKGPFPRATDIDVYWGPDTSGCKMRVRVKYVRTINGPVITSPYYYTTNPDSDRISFTNIYRCSTTVGLRRKDGTYFTKIQRGGSADAAGCP